MRFILIQRIVFDKSFYLFFAFICFVWSGCASDTRLLSLRNGMCFFSSFISEMNGMVKKGDAIENLGSILAKWLPSGIFFLSRRLSSLKFLLAHELERTVRFSGGIFSIMPINRATFSCLPHFYSSAKSPLEAAHFLD